MAGTVWTKFFWSDWESDPALRLCDLSAQGLWMRMLCVAAQHDPCGYVAIAGRPLGVTDIARLAGVTETEAGRLLDNLAVNGVFSRDRHGCIYSRRMVRDARNQKKAVQSGKKGGTVSYEKQRGIFRPSKGPPRPPSHPEAICQIPEKNKPPPPSSSSASADDGGGGGLFQRCVSVIGLDLTRLPSQAWLTLPVKIDAWQRAGCRPDDIVDGFRVVMAKRKSGDFPSSPAYFEKAVLRQRDDRLAIEGGKTADADWGPDDPSWRSLVKAHLDGVWFEDRWGPRIGQPGCRVPQKFLDKSREAA